MGVMTSSIIEQEEFYIVDLTYEDYKKFVAPEIDKQQNIAKIDLSSLQKMNNILYDLYASNPNYLAALFKDLYIQFKKKEKVDNTISSRHISKYWSALNLYYFLKDQKKESHSKAFRCAKKELEKHNIDTKDLYSIIQAFESFKKIRI